jgi:hypothetical protein
MFYVGLIYRKPSKPYDHRVFFIRVRSEPFACAFCDTVPFNEKSARVAVRRYIKGNLSAALVCYDDGANEPATAREKRYANSLSRRLMIPGKGPGGFEVDYGPCHK